MTNMSFCLFQPSDPFGTDPFLPGGGRSKAPPRPGKSPAPGAQHSKSPAPRVPSLPSKQKKAPAPPRPPAPKAGAKSPLHAASPVTLNEDPFGGFDPFGSGATSVASGAKSADLFSAQSSKHAAKSHSADLFSGSGFADFSGVSDVNHTAMITT